MSMEYFRIPVAALDKTKGLPMSTALVYIHLLCLVDLAGSNKIAIGHRDFVERLGFTVNTIGSAKAALEKAGLISIERPTNRSLPDTITVL